ncbi:hypothetical protein NOR_07677 [Metarhizium rileyi]|uniref:Uncharacterized protein n=1 Tax=Metarhizium rileyi (strain RCEF 4871) TaxID=1649241 RepID=A0A166XQI8_METRR|nr:hypothetical protein NOR_07677 [Metarhizium rileyi RCEF 4871]TWU72952.1 hypothetical protein ED733_003107 [Metarhizium rileyi]
MTSSMVDLVPPQRRPSVGSLRQASSDWNLRSSTVLPIALGGSGLRPGAPSRPSGAQKADWVNPLDVHFCKTSVSTRPSTPLGPNVAAAAAAPVISASPKNPLDQFDFGPHADTYIAATSPHKGQLGQGLITESTYPSPPQSDRVSERTVSPVNALAYDHQPSIGKRNAHSGLRNVDVSEPKSPPSPVPSFQQTTDSHSSSLSTRNVHARRDTFAFHQPRRRSFTKEFEEGHRATMMHPPKEGFSGNFADFDFGESVAKTNTRTAEAIPSWESITRPCLSSEATKDTDRGAPTTPANIRSPLLTHAERAGLWSPAPIHASHDSTTNTTLVNQLPKPPLELALRPLGPPPAAAGAYRVYNADTGMGLRQGFRTRLNPEKSSRASPPRPLKPVISLSIMGGVGGVGNAVRNAASPTEKLTSSPFSRPPMEGSFPISKGLPRGRRPEPPPLQLQPSPVEDSPFSIATWSDFDRLEPRRSAIPAPLTPSRPRPSDRVGPGFSTPTSATPPRIPSPTFPSLATSISISSDAFAKTWEMDLDDTLSSPTLGGFPSIDRRPITSQWTSPERVEAKKAPPHPAPVGPLPISDEDIARFMKSPVLTDFQTFI